MNQRHLIRLFFLCLAMTVVAFAVMKYFEKQFRFNDENNTSFSILDVEFAKSKDGLSGMYDKMDRSVRESLRAHLFTDYFFMTGCYPGIAALCLLVAVREKKLRTLFVTLACLQVLPWLFDVTENIQLVCWMDNKECQESFSLFKILVRAKFGLAGGSFLVTVIGLTKVAVSR